MTNPREEILLELGRSPHLAHALLFGHKHAVATPAFHHRILTAWHSDEPNILIKAFRGGAKSTLAEEAMIVMCCLQRARNVIIIGDSEGRAIDRLRSMKSEFENNERIAAVFDVGPGGTWGDAKAVLSNGIMMQAFGRGQSLRGAKYLDYRPDLAFLDDLEDEESVKTPEARDKTKQWLFKTLLPAMARGGRIRMAATPLDQKALAQELERQPNWRTQTYPVEFIDPVSGERRATWPEMFPLKWIDETREAYKEAGVSDAFMQEYMMQASDPAMRTFTEGMMKVEPHVRTWQAVYAMYDPARTTHQRSATTGKVVWSWVGPKLVIWDAAARRWMPSEIVDDVFATDAIYNPVAIGIEETGLNEFLLQPIRQQMALRGQTIPLRALHAPRGKLDFIRALQPFFRAGEVVFVHDMPELRSQLLSFPTGDIDAPNALAYALKMRPGQPIYEGFGHGCMTEPLAPSRQSLLWLAVHASHGATAAALVQIRDGRLLIYSDWLREGLPGDSLAHIVMEASMLAGMPFKLICPPSHFAGYDTIGLRAAVAKVPAEIRKGGDPVQGREEIRELLRKATGAGPALSISTDARWTARAFAGGYCRSMDDRAALSDTADDNAYKVVAEAIESFAAVLRHVENRDDKGVQYAISSSGKKYISARG